MNLEVFLFILQCEYKYFVKVSSFQEGQLSVTGECMCTKYWLTA